MNLGLYTKLLKYQVNSSEEDSLSENERAKTQFQSLKEVTQSQSTKEVKQKTPEDSYDSEQVKGSLDYSHMSFEGSSDPLSSNKSKQVKEPLLKKQPTLKPQNFQRNSNSSPFVKNRMIFNEQEVNSPVGPSGSHSFSSLSEESAEEKFSDTYDSETESDDQVNRIRSQLDFQIVNMFHKVKKRNTKKTNLTKPLMGQEYVRILDESKDVGRIVTDRTAKQNKETYITNLGIDFWVPEINILDAQINKQDATYYFQLVKYVFGKKQDYDVCSHYLDGKIKNEHYTDMEKFKKFKDSIIIRVLKRDPNKSFIQSEPKSYVIKKANKVILRFSECGTTLALFIERKEGGNKIIIVRINENESIIEFINKLNEKIYESSYISFASSSFINQLVFDQNPDGNYLVGLGETRFIVFDTKKMNQMQNEITEINDMKKCSHIDYEKIWDLQFKSHNDGRKQCFIAVSKRNNRQIVMFDYYQCVETYHLHFYHDFDTTEQTIIKISSDFKSIFFTDFREKIIVEVKENYTDQWRIQGLQGKYVKYIIEDAKGKGFYYICCSDYGNKLILGHTHHKDSILKFDRDVEPGIIKVFDLIVVSDEFNEKRTIRMLSMRDDDFIIDQAKVNLSIPDETLNFDNQSCEEDDDQEIKKYLKQDIKIEQTVFKDLRAFSFKWPFVACTGFGPYILLINGFEEKKFKRIQIDKDDGKMQTCLIFITETNELFFVTKEPLCNCESQETLFRKSYIGKLNETNCQNCSSFQFKLFRIQLSVETAIDPKFKLTDKNNLIFKYRQSKDLVAFHVRGSADKNDQNKKLIVFFQHGDHVYSWRKLTTCHQNEKEKFVCHSTSKKFYQLDNNQIYFLYNEKQKDGKTLIQQKIQKIKINFSNYECTQILVNKNPHDIIKQIAVDHQTGRIIILSKLRPQNDQYGKIVYKVKIFDDKQSEFIFEIIVRDKDFIGRLKSGLFTFIGDHIFYNNHVIKMRQDLITSSNSKTYTEEQIFDHYSQIFNLNQNHKVQCYMPLNSQQFQKLVYVIKDESSNMLKMVRYLPQLQNRQLILGPEQESDEYFFTSIEAPIKNPNCRLSLTNVNGPTQTFNSDDSFVSHEDSSMSQEIDEELMHQINCQRNHQHDHEIHENVFQIQRKEAQIIISLNLSKLQYSVYSQNGVKLKSYKFRENTYYPIAVSSNGSCFIFTNDRMIDLKLYKITIDGFKLLKTIRFLEKIQETMNVKKINKLNIKCLINDFLDICVKICFQKNQPVLNKNQSRSRSTSNKKQDQKILKSKCITDIDSDDDEEENEFYDQVLFFFQMSTENTGKFFKQDKDDEESHDYIFNMNNKYIFIQDKNRINYYEISKELQSKPPKQLKFQIPQNIKLTNLEILVGSNPDRILIDVGEAKNLKFLTFWDLNKNISKRYLFNIEGEYEILWDNKGYPYLVQGNMINMIQQRCSVYTFNFGSNTHKLIANSDKFYKNRGIRVDGNNHNWILRNKILYMPFSYMSFVILDKIEENCCNKLSNNKIFDQEGYNYIFFKGTSFTDGSFVYNDHKLLDFVLKNASKYSPNLLYLLNYRQELCKPNKNISNHLLERFKTSLTIATKKKHDESKTMFFTKGDYNTAIHKALKNTNNQSVNILLKNLRHLENESSKNFSSIFKDLVDYQSFIDLLNKLPFQTPMMMEKQVLKVNGTYNKQIIKFENQSDLNIDKWFPKDLNDQHMSSFPVKIVALNVAWLLNDNGEGLAFLQAVDDSQNMELYNIPTLQMVIEMLYTKFKSCLFAKLIYIYITQFITFHSIIWISEFEHENAKSHRFDDSDASFSKEFREVLFKVCGPIALVCNFLTVGLIIQSQLKYFKSMQSRILTTLNIWVDIVYILANVIMMFNSSNYKLSFSGTTSKHSSTKSKELLYYREAEVMGIIAIYIKGLGFLKLVDSIAPIIDTLISILKDIRSFLLVLSVFVACFSVCFFLLGQNQINYDDSLDSEDIYLIPYSTLQRSLWFVYYTMVMGNQNILSFDEENSFNLSTLFVFASFIMVIVLLNMLIAVMGNTFAERQQIAEQVTTQDRLRFVLNNWHMKSDIKDFKSYIVAAFAQEFEQDDQITMNELQKQIKIQNLRQIEIEQIQTQILQVVSQMNTKLDSKLEVQRKQDQNKSRLKHTKTRNFSIIKQKLQIDDQLNDINLSEISLDDFDHLEKN